MVVNLSESLDCENEYFEGLCVFLFVKLDLKCSCEKTCSWCDQCCIGIDVRARLVLWEGVADGGI